VSDISIDFRRVGRSVDACLNRRELRPLGLREHASMARAFRPGPPYRRGEEVDVFKTGIERRYTVLDHFRSES